MRSLPSRTPLLVALLASLGPLAGAQGLALGLAPYGCAYRDGRHYVRDLGGALAVLDLAGREFALPALDGRARLQKPCKLAFAADGILHVADLGRRQVIVLGPELDYRGEFGPFDAASRPADVDARGEELAPDFASTPSSVGERREVRRRLETAGSATLP